MCATARTRNRTFTAGGVLLASTLLGGLMAAPPAVAVQTPAAERLCTAPGDPGLAARMDRDLRSVLRQRGGTVAFDVQAPGHGSKGVTCARNAHTLFDAASVAKVLILETVLHRAASERRGPTPRESRLLRAMITRSDNGAASTLWRDVGLARLKGVLRLAGAGDTSLAARRWGLTRTSARDQTRLLGLLTRPGSPLGHPRHALDLLAQVDPAQRWGVSAGAPHGVTVHLKNGWLPRRWHGWRVHSVGAFTGEGTRKGTRKGPYRIAVLTQDNPGMRSGVRTIELLSATVHRHLATGRTPARPFTPGGAIDARPDGSDLDARVTGRETPEEPRSLITSK
ncbi:serine hydrolase [Streptomyces sp. NPDC048172]|uniref:serine hydrolase n=1 Tax=Streptomyces sp. NPDC048172 TaxID=3365505 RepID=UPI003712BC3A